MQKRWCMGVGFSAIPKQYLSHFFLHHFWLSIQYLTNLWTWLWKGQAHLLQNLRRGGPCTVSYTKKQLQLSLSRRDLTTRRSDVTINFNIVRGVLQSDFTSSLFFILALEFIMWCHDATQPDKGVGMTDTMTHALGYEDDDVDGSPTGVQKISIPEWTLSRRDPKRTLTRFWMRKKQKLCTSGAKMTSPRWRRKRPREYTSTSDLILTVVSNSCPQLVLPMWCLRPPCPWLSSLGINIHKDLKHKSEKEQNFKIWGRKFYVTEKTQKLVSL